MWREWHGTEHERCLLSLTVTISAYPGLTLNSLLNTNLITLQAAKKGN